MIYQVDTDLFTFSHVQVLEATGKKYLIALDSSESMMQGNVTGSRMLRPLEAACTMTMALLRTEVKCDVMVLSSSENEFIDLNPSMTLQEVMQVAEQVRSSVALHVPVHLFFTNY